MTEFKEMVEGTTYVVETPPCFHCGKSGSIEVPMKGFLVRQLGGLIQDAYPDMSAPLREQMVSGTHPQCWDEMFGPEEE